MIASNKSKNLYQKKLRRTALRAAVALSGGVDSSVAAALLKKQGGACLEQFDAAHRKLGRKPCLKRTRRVEIIGLYMRLWKSGLNKAQQAQTEKRVKQIGRILGIKIFIFDFKKEFKKYVVKYFIDSQKKGITPNPCVVCNQEIKFGLLLKKAKELGCNYLATGHYARVRHYKLQVLDGEQGRTTTNYKLLRAKDRTKDQTYFLWRLGQKELKRILFPIGEIESKQKIRAMAKKFGLPTAKTPESNDICFLGALSPKDFLGKSLKIKKGKISDTKGNILGGHQGLWFYTIGQRKGINIPVKKGRAALPWFVVGKDIKRNVLIVSQKEKDLFKKELTAKDVNWIFGIEPKLPLRVSAKIRYGALPDLAVIKEKTGPKKYRIVFAKLQRAITPGQSVVFYKENELLGGGVIFQ